MRMLTGAASKRGGGAGETRVGSLNEQTQAVAELWHRRRQDRGYGGGGGKLEKERNRGGGGNEAREVGAKRR